MMESANGQTKTVTVKPANTKADPTVVKAAGGHTEAINGAESDMMGTGVMTDHGAHTGRILVVVMPAHMT